MDDLLLDPDSAPTALFERPTEDPDGNAPHATVGTFPVVVDLTGPGIASGSGTQYAQGGLVFVPRGTPVLIGDRFPWGGQKYMLSGGPDGDMDHPMTGDDFGWVPYTIIGQIARWGGG